MTMTSKLDFNVILAKAEKNSNQAQKLLEEKKLQLKKLQDQKKAQPSKEAALVYLEKKKEEARKRAEQEARELLEKKRNKLLAEKQNEQKTSTKKPIAPTKPSNTTKPQAKAPAQTTKSSSSAKPTTSKPVQTNKKPSSSKVPPPGPQKPALSYQDILKLADQNKDKPKTDSTKPKESLSLNKIPSKPVKNSLEPSTSATASSSSSLSSKLTPEQIAKLKEKQKLPSALAHTKPPSHLNKTDINNNKNKLNLDKASLNDKKSVLTETKTNKPSQPSISAWDRIMSDMKKNPNLKIPNKKNVNSNESDEGDMYEEEEEYDSEMEDFIDDEEEDTEEYRKYIRKMFKYDPNKYKDEDDDIDNMETDYQTLLREEKRSLKLGIMEDIEEMKREAEMERRRLEKKKKRQSESDIDRGSDKKIKK
ncbi:unnamed protein product [Brachionus calyciflorus]|uniref:Protein SPT2 homolog n=1 Tax=Brachionus calyciflorus TaxID=104777 RepID=A0A813MJG8_9BILA|nr:unnamed protein product [Brachionus calyciflorus]